MRIREPAPPPSPAPRPCAHAEIMQDGRNVPACRAIIDFDGPEEEWLIVMDARGEHVEWTLDTPFPVYRVREELLGPDGRPYGLDARAIVPHEGREP
jgi:hypothetical protein